MQEEFSKMHSGIRTTIKRYFFSPTHDMKELLEVLECEVVVYADADLRDEGSRMVL
jgi:hypothetical protein